MSEEFSAIALFERGIFVGIAEQIPATGFEGVGVYIAVAAIALAVVLVLIFTKKKK